MLMQGRRRMRMGKARTPVTCLRCLVLLLLPPHFVSLFSLSVFLWLSLLPGRLDRGSVGVVDCLACLFRGLLLEGRFVRRLQRATGPKIWSKDVGDGVVGENTRFLLWLAIFGVMAH